MNDKQYMVVYIRTYVICAYYQTKYNCYVHHDTAPSTKAPGAATDLTQSTPAGLGGTILAMLDGAKAMEVNAQAMSGAASKEKTSRLCVNTVSIVELKVDKHCE